MFQFEKHKKKLKERLSIQELADIDWAEISQQSHNFERRNVEIDQLHFITEEVMLEFFEVGNYYTVIVTNTY